MHASTFLTLALCLICGPSLVATEPVWNGWLGPERNGQVPGFAVPESWPQGLSEVWKVEAGTGYGTPIVVGDRVFQHGRIKGSEVVTCFDLASGKRLWQEGEPVAFTIGGGGDFHGKGPKSSPVYADGRIFTLSIAGMLTARDAKDGKLLWQNDYKKEFKSNQPYWGVSTSPLVDGEQLVVHLGNDEVGALFAFDVKTGAVAWRHGKDGTDYSSPIVIEIHGVRQIVEWNHEDVLGVESQTGKLLWKFHWPHRGNQQNTPTPIYHDGFLIVGGEKRGIRGLEPVLDNGRWTVKERWHQEEVSLNMSTTVISEGHVFGLSEYKRGRLFCLDPKTGNVHWQTKGREGDHATFLSVPGHVLVLSQNGELKILKATPQKYEEVVTYEVADSPTWAPPVLLSDGLLIKAQNKLIRWRF